MVYLINFLIGLAFGSFSSVIIHRLRSGEKGILMGRSKCPKCHTTLGFLDLIPLLSWVLQKGKCRHCPHSVSIMYPLLELLMGGFFVLTTYLSVGLPDWQLGYYLFLTFIFILLSIYDILYQEVPDVISLPTILISGAMAHLSGLFVLSEIWLGFWVPVLFFGIMFFGSQGRWIGGGDVRIGGIMGFVLGWPAILVGLFLGYFIGAILSIFGLISGKVNRKSLIPFGPFLFAGTYIALFFGEEIMNWYLQGMML